MLRTRQLVDILEGYLGDGVIMTMVLYENGNVLGCAANEKCKESDLEKTVSAIIPNIWDTYSTVINQDNEEGDDQSMSMMTFTFEHGQVVLRRCFQDALVCIVGGEEAQLGWLVARAKPLSETFEEILAEAFQTS